jgi:hypothetical protein
MKTLLILLCLVAAPALAQDNPVLIHRPTDRVVPTKSSPECVYVESPWGTPCRVMCAVNYFPMWFSDNRILHFKMMTDRNDAPVMSSFDFTDQDGTKLAPNSGNALKFVEWWDREPGDEYNAVPMVGCYCNDLTGIVYICRNGVVVEEIAKKLPVTG